MKSVSVLRVFVLACCCCVVQVLGTYTVTVELQSYENPSHRAAQEDVCCDGACHNHCDNAFTFCLTASREMAELAGMLRVTPEEAGFSCQLTTEVLEINSDNITFPLSGETMLNPLEIKGGIWQGQAYIFVIVTDLDFEYNLDDKVDSILVSIQPSSLMQYSTYKTYAGTFGYGSLTARYRVDCDDHFFRDDCSVFCNDTDGVDGHYTCDENGNKQCLNGYQNSSTNCTECIPAFGCSPVGGFCSVPGDCTCLPGYTGEKCTEEVTSQSVPDVAVYVLAALSAVLVVTLLSVALIILIPYIWRKAKGASKDGRDYYECEDLRPNQQTDSLAKDGTIASRQVDSSPRQTEMLASGHSTLSHSQGYPPPLPTSPVPSRLDYSLSSNVAYGTYNSTRPSAERTAPDSSLSPNVAYGTLDRSENMTGAVPDIPGSSLSQKVLL